MARVILVDGRPVEPGDPVIAADDPGLLGQGVYESLRTYDGRPFAVGRHLDRLLHGAATLGLDVERDRVEADLRHAATAAGGDGELTIRIVVTGRGVRIVDAGPLVERSPTARLATLPWPRAVRSPLTGIKAASTASALVARRHVTDVGADEGLWLTEEGRVSEAIAANVFAVLGGRLVTPPLSDGPLAGVTRSLLLELGAEERSLPLAALAAADEAFLSASSLPARAVVELDGRPLGGGRPGPTTQRLAETFAAEASALLGADD